MWCTVQWQKLLHPGSMPVHDNPWIHVCRFHWANYRYVHCSSWLKMNIFICSVEGFITSLLLHVLTEDLFVIYDGCYYAFLISCSHFRPRSESSGLDQGYDGRPRRLLIEVSSLKFVKLRCTESIPLPGRVQIAWRLSVQILGLWHVVTAYGTSVLTPCSLYYSSTQTAFKISSLRLSCEKHGHLQYSLITQNVCLSSARHCKHLISLIHEKALLPIIEDYHLHCTEWFRLMQAL